MKVDLTCAQVQIELSARLDQEVDSETSRLLDAHLEECSECRAYEDALRSVKRAVALQPAPVARDLAPSVTAQLIRDSMSRRSERRSLLRTAIAAAAVTALVLSGALVPWQERSPDVALASEITRAVQGAASEITSYHATFDVTERGWHDDIPERHLTAEIWFRAPEHLRFELRDHTSYPGPGWPTNHVTLMASPRRWVLEETASCPTAALPGCEISPEPETRALKNRQPFDGSTPLPTDLILPLETLSEESGLTVIGRTSVNGREAHQVALEYWQAAPLVRSLQVAGRWHKFPARARVDLWLDTETWFPLRFSVRSGGASLLVENTAFDATLVDESTFELPGGIRASDGGFRSSEADGPLPGNIAGLDPYRMGVTRDGQRIATFSDGLTWLRVLSDDDTRPTLATFASELVELSEGDFGYVEPSTDPLRRTVEVIGNRRRVRIESNLPRGALLEVAASVPIAGRAFDRIETRDGTTIERVSAAALEELGYAVSPTYLPPGFEFSTAFVSRSHKDSQQLTVYYRRPDSAAGSTDIRVVHAPGYSVLPPTSENLVSVKIGGLRARWSPQRSELEWLDGSTYRAVSVPAFDLETAAVIARGLTQ